MDAQSGGFKRSFFHFPLADDGDIPKVLNFDGNRRSCPMKVASLLADRYAIAGFCRSEDYCGADIGEAEERDRTSR